MNNFFFNAARMKENRNKSIKIPKSRATFIFYPSFLGNAFFFSFFFFFFQGHTCGRHMEVPRPGVRLELQPLSYATPTARWDPSHTFDLHHSSRQCRSPTHQARPGAAPASSCVPVRFVSLVPQQELPGQ